MTIVLNLSIAIVEYLTNAPIIVQLPVAIVVLFYSFAHDWHEDAKHYREALDELGL